MQVDAQEIILLQAGAVNRWRFAPFWRHCLKDGVVAGQASGRIGRGLMFMPVSPRSQNAPENR